MATSISNLCPYITFESPLSDQAMLLGRISEGLTTAKVFSLAPGCVVAPYEPFLPGIFHNGGRASPCEREHKSNYEENPVTMATY